MKLSGAHAGAPRSSQGTYFMLRSSCTVRLAIALSVAGLLLSSSHAQTRYVATATGIGGNGGSSAGAASMGPTALSDLGQVVGNPYPNPFDHTGFSGATLFDGTKLVYLGKFGVLGAYATAINNAEQIVGTSYTDTNPSIYQAYLYDHGTVLNLGFLPGGTTSRARGINAHGDIIGTGDSTVYFGNRSFFYHDGQMTDLGDLGGFSATAFAINDAGQIVGSSTGSATATQIGPIEAFLYQNGQMTDLGGFGGRYSSAQAINNAGQIVGAADYPNQGPRHAVLWQNGQMADLGVLGNGTSSFAYGINNSGQIVGTSWASPIGAIRAFLYQNGRMVDLNCLVEPIVGVSSVLFADSDSHFDQADAINDHGQILAPGHPGGTVSVDFYVLTPVTPGRLVNFSFRGSTGVNTQPIILGFVVAGSQKNLLLRGIGPGLTALGVSTALVDPQIKLFAGSAVIAANDDWGAVANPTDTAAATATGAFPLAAGSKDAALLYAANAGGYTAHIFGASGGPGVALAEIYDADGSATTSRMINASGLLPMGAGDNTAIAGFVIAGTYGDTVLIRAVGPGLSRFGLAGVPNPQITLFDASGTKQGTNAGWGGNALLAQMSAQVGAFPLDDAGADAMLVASVKPGAYTVHVTGGANPTGQVLLEVYELR